MPAGDYITPYTIYEEIAEPTISIRSTLADQAEDEILIIPKIGIHNQTPLRERATQYSFIIVYGGYFGTQFNRNGKRSIITCHSPNVCGVCNANVKALATRNILGITHNFVKYRDYSLHGIWKEEQLTDVASHTPTPRDGGSPYILPSNVDYCDRDGDRWVTKFMGGYRMYTLHNPKFCWDCIMEVSRKSEQIEQDQEHRSGYADGEMNLETGGFWYDNHFIECNEYMGSPPETTIRLNSLTNQFELCTPDGRVFKTVTGTIRKTIQDEIKEEMDNLFQKIDNNQELLHKLKQHVSWFGEYGIK